MFQPGTRLHDDRYEVLKPLGQGGFSQTFEVDDHGTVKVLKVLLETYPKAIDLFQREFKVLSQLRHPGIPHVDSDGYFTVPSDVPEQMSHCLIMERIPGVDLRQWLKTRDYIPVGETMALDWLKQLAEILDQLHQHHCFHRDIKPSNVMLRPDGQLVLIDFGAVREVTETFLHKQQDDVTRTHLYSRGYTPMEQMQGRAVPESDFFALGRTFVHLLTGCNPLDFPTDFETGALLWRDHAPYLSVAFADLIDQLMAPFVAKRPKDPQAILARITTVQTRIANGDADLVRDSFDETSRPPSSSTLVTAMPPETITMPPPGDATALWEIGVKSPPSSAPSPQRGRSGGWVSATACSLVATLGVMGVRLSGLLQGVELHSFDQLMRWRSPTPSDDRIVLITVGNDDIEYQNQQGWARQGSLSDDALAQLLAKLQPHRPRLIGLDIYRSAADSGVASEEDVSFGDALGQSDNLVAVCAVGGGDKDYPAIAPPDEIPLERIGFSNIPYDPDGVVRRQLVGMSPDTTCNSDQSLSAQLAFRYLSQENLDITLEGGTLYIGDRALPPILSRLGGYQHPAVLRDGGYQLLLNYHSTPRFAPELSLAAILEGDEDENLAELVGDRIVLIGTTDLSYGDYHPTPYGELPGVVIQSHMVSQLLSTVLDERPLVWGLPLFGDLLWVLGWSTVTGGVIVMGRSRWQQGGGLVVLIVGLAGLSFVALLQGGWLPLVPSVIAMSLTAIGSVSIPRLVSPKNPPIPNK